MKKFLTVITIVAIVVIGMWVFGRQEEQLYESAYPVKYEELVLAACEEYEISPSLMFALIYTESRFRPEAVSAVGATGLTQITKDTFDWIQWRRDEDSPWVYEDVTKPEVAVDYGAYLLAHHLREFGSVEQALCAYNAGRGNLLSWLKKDEYSKDTPNGRILTVIPLKETENYVKQINEVALMYQKLYNYQ